MNTETDVETNANHWQDAAAAISVKLGRDHHLASCDLAKEGGPDATLACAECGRALWMHSTRHDTCGYFHWVIERTLTDKQVGQLGTIAGLPDEIRQACARSLNSYALAPCYVREARLKCAAAINNAKRDQARIEGRDHRHRTARHEPAAGAAGPEAPEANAKVDGNGHTWPAAPALEVP